MYTYEYNGPIYRFNAIIGYVKAYTTAVSFAKAKCNLKWRFAREYGSKFIVYNIDENCLKLKE